MSPRPPLTIPFPAAAGQAAGALPPLTEKLLIDMAELARQTPPAGSPRREAGRP
jgi:hypothetical protein